MPIIEFDSNWAGQASAENLVGYKKAKFSRFHAVVVVAKPLEDLLLRDGTVSNVTALQRTGAILAFQAADALRVFFVFHAIISRSNDSTLPGVLNSSRDALRICESCGDFFIRAKYPPSQTRNRNSGDPK